MSLLLTRSGDIVLVDGFMFLRIISSFSDMQVAHAVGTLLDDTAPTGLTEYRLHCIQSFYGCSISRAAEIVEEQNRALRSKLAGRASCCFRFEHVLEK